MMFKEKKIYTGTLHKRRNQITERVSQWVVLILGFLLAGSMGRVNAQELFAYPPADKIDGEILAHQREKIQPAGTSLAEHRQNLNECGLNSGNLDREDVALYVKNRLTDTEITALQVEGIHVHATWVPPVAGKHPYGFHLATIEYRCTSFLEQDDRFVLVESTEYQHQALNDLGAIRTNVDDVHAGNGVTAATGAGVIIAVADSGIDLNHPDFPVPVEAFDMTDGVGVGSWGTNVANTVTGHGTHVTGTALGRGTQSGGTYKGMAPAAGLAFYKIGNDGSASASSTDEIEAITRAGVIGADVFTMSYGGLSAYMDGSSAMSAAIDAAEAAGMCVFISAGNEANASDHDSTNVAPGTTTPVGLLNYRIVNPSATTPYSAAENIRVIWRDGSPGNANLVLSCANLGIGETLVQSFSSFSNRGTEGKRYTLNPIIPPGSVKSYFFTLTNNAASGNTPRGHLYRSNGVGFLESADPSYTVNNPALADGACAVGAWVQRKFWTTYRGLVISYVPAQTVGTLATFSSLGPRIDDVIPFLASQKPDFLAPGSATISSRDAPFHNSETRRIDNDGINNGLGPADYYVLQGTSMACPHAAGAAALLKELNPSATPGEIKTALTSTAELAGNPNNNDGYGLIDALGAAQGILPCELVGLEINGDPSSVVFTAGPLDLTLDMDNCVANSLDWYFAYVINSTVVWITSGGTSSTPAPLVSSPPVELTNLTLISTTLPSGTVISFAWFMYDPVQAQVLDQDIISVVVN
jgi:subtilisin family serine protease